MNQEILDYLIERLATLPELPASQERFDTFIAAATDSFARRSGIESPMAGLPKSPSPLDGYTVPKDPGPLAEPDLEDAESVDFQATEAQESGEIQLAPTEAPETPQDAPGSTIPEKASDGLTERVKALESFLERLLAVEQASGQWLLSIRAEDESAKAEPEVQRSVQGVGDDEPLYLKYQPELLPDAEDSGTYVNPVGILPADISAEAEAAQTDTWDRTDQGDTYDGLEIKVCTRIAYGDAGDETLYAYYRTMKYDSAGKLVTISAETRYTVDAPEACT